MDLELHKNYTLSELYDIFGTDWAYILKLSNIPKTFNKPKIISFEDFDEETKQKYIAIAQIIKEVNLDNNWNLWAVGSRIDGSWKTKEEAEAQAIEYKRLQPKYSDYDFVTNAEIIPKFERLDLHCNGTKNWNINRKVLIPKEVY